jgi:glycosyltransferase involved in cell wall biosynthesis
MVLKKIFVSLPWFAPAFKAGGPVQSIANMVNELQDGYAFYIFCSNTDLHGEPLQISGREQWLQHNTNTKVWYNGRENRSANLMAQVKEIKPDILYIIGVFDWHYNLVPLLFAKVPRKIVSVRGSLHPGAMGQKSFKKKPFLLVMKMLKWTKWTAFQATDLAESGYIQNNLGHEAHIFVAGNFPRIIGRQQLPMKSAGELRLISIGIISKMKNILLVLQSLQHLKTLIKYDIYGPVRDVGYWESCQQQIKLLPSNIRVCYHKEVEPQKVAETLCRSHVFILPSKSENFGHAIFEAMSAGLPEITSFFNPWN